jgi:signal transduction histidine kinase
VRLISFTRRTRPRAGPGLRPRTAFWCAWSLWALAVGVTATSFIYNAIDPLPARLGNQGSPAAGLVAVAFIGGFCTMGALLAWKRAANPIGWLLCGTGLSYAAGGSGVLLQHFSATLAFGNWLGWAFLFGIALTVFVLLLFPTGTLPSRRWRPVAWVAAASLTGWVLGNAFATRLFTDNSHRANPFGIRGAAGQAFAVLAGGSGLLIVVVGLAAIVSLVVRYHRARTVEREQLKWLVYAAALIVMSLLAQILIAQTIRSSDAAANLENVVTSGAVAAVPVAIGVAIFRYRLYDIDLVINRTLVYGSLAAFITGGYVAIVVGIGSLVQHGARPSLGLSILATAVVAVAFQPVRERVQHLANRLVYGRRATPYEMLSEFSARMTGTLAAQELLPRMAEILAEGTGAARADVWLRAGVEFRDAAAWPSDAPLLPALHPAAPGLPTLEAADQIRAVHHQGEVLGALSVSKRPGESLTTTEGRLLSDLAAQAGLVLRNVGLTDQLLVRLEEVRASRQRLVAAQDEERRRIERNIHDGAQQQLVALAIKLSLTESLIGSDEEGERELLGELRADAQDAAANLRDLARGIYPPLLAGQGLVTALRAQAEKSPVRAAVQADGIGRYRRDIEAVVYFCVLEALQNVAKYAVAESVRVRLARSGDDLTFEVTDDGVGFDPAATAHGTGLEGIADRLNALGGVLEIRAAPGTGTCLIGRLPAAVLEAVR